MIPMCEKINSFEKLKTHAIIMCDEVELLETQTFKDLLKTSEKFEKFFSKHIQINKLCMGLVMKKNIYLPSIILSLQKLKYAFVYIPSKKLDDGHENCDCEYILTFIGEKIHAYEIIAEIKVNKCYTFVLWRSQMQREACSSLTDIFCIVHSSGTTGRDKTIRIPYECIEYNAESLGKLFKLKSDDIIFWGTPLSFDPSLIELLLALFNGATLVIVPDSTYVNPQSLFSALFNVAQVTVIQMVPSVFHRWADSYVQKILNSDSLRILAFGGEAFPKTILKFDRIKTLKLFNLYGITELSCWATVHEVCTETFEDDVPIGICLDGIIVEVRADSGEVVEEGVGEIFIGSKVRRCYIDEETDTNLPLFRETGDMGYIKNTIIFYKGRKNKIIKRYGQRINLTSIENIILEKCDLTAKCVWSEKYNKLLTFILIKENHTKSVSAKILDKIRTKLLHSLKEHSFPDYFEILQIFPTTCHGKVDERKLEEFYTVNMSSKNYEPLDLFRNLWCKHLGVNIENSDYLKQYSFFEMGGNSISILQLISEFRQLTNINSTELEKTIFTMKYSDCINVILKANCSEKIIEVTPKRQRLEYPEMKILWKHDLKACIDGPPVIFTVGNENRIAVGSFCNIFTILDDCGREILKTVLDGSIESSPTISRCQKFIYIGCYDGTAYCIDMNMQKIMWKFKTGDKIKSSAVCSEDGDKVMFGSYDKFIYCLSSEDGSVLWKRAVDGSVASNLIYREKYGIFATTTKGTCYSISDSNGDINWTFNCGSPVFGTPCVLERYEQIVIPSVIGSLFTLSLNNGKLVCTFQSNGHIFSSLFVYNDYITFGCHDKNIFIMKASAVDLTLVGRIELNSEISSTPFIYQFENFIGIVAASNVGTIYLINLHSLSVLKQVRLPGEVFCSPIVHGNKVYVGCRDNNLYCLSLE